MKGGAAALLVTAALGTLASAPVRAGPAPSASTQLRATVRRALTAPDALGNRYAKSVWLEDMSERLAPFVPDAEKRRRLLGLIHAEAARAGVPASLVLAMINVESDFKPWAVSSVGAQGLMQIMPFWLKAAGKPGDNLFDPQTNLRIGCTVLAYYLRLSHGDIAEALQRYYGNRFGTRYTSRVLQLLNSRWYWKR